MSIKFVLIFQILAFGAVAALALPQGTGKISQFHYQNGAGEINHGFVNGEGIYHRSQRLSDGEVIGEYGYVNADGVPVHVRYSSGVEGYKVLPSDPSAYSAANVRQAIPELTAARDLTDAGWESTYQFSHSNDKSYPNSDLEYKSVWNIAEPENGFDNSHPYQSGPQNN